jgi:hypothetical protein
VLAEFEALSLSNLNVNHPNWANQKLLMIILYKTTAIKHPLILEKMAMFQFSAPPNKTIDVLPVLLVVYTFLRTLGINMVLAYVEQFLLCSSF